MAINKTLKFSWGHIIAFVALIFISYVSFMGITYLTDGNFFYAGIGVFIINIMLIVLFIVPQMLKGADNKFRKKIVFERILIFTAPLFFAVAMVPYSHFWTVFDNRSTVQTTFSESVKTVKGMFESYEIYTENRIKDFREKLGTDEMGVVNCDIDKNISVIQRQSELTRSNKVEALRLQISADNYLNLKKTAFDWIDNATEATVWNVFMIGNISKIEEAVDNWNISLNSFSSKIMTDESENVVPFSSSDPSVVTAKKNLNKLSSVYTRMKFPTYIAICSGLLMYIFLLFPYVIQSRNTKSTFRLFGLEKNSSSMWYNENKKSNSLDGGDDGLGFDINDRSSARKDDYGSFTM